jgi:hypothetical protein
MKNGTLLGDVDFLAVKHGSNSAAEAGRLSQVQQKPHGVVRHPVFGIVQIDAKRLNRQSFAPFRIFSK